MLAFSYVPRIWLVVWREREEKGKGERMTVLVGNSIRLAVKSKAAMLLQAEGVGKEEEGKERRNPSLFLLPLALASGLLERAQAPDRKKGEKRRKRKGGDGCSSFFIGTPPQEKEKKKGEKEERNRPVHNYHCCRSHLDISMALIIVFKTRY